MTESEGGLARREGLVAHYERLRRDAISPSSSGGEGLGLALFLRRGMVAWIEAWSQCTDRASDCEHHLPAMDESLPGHMRSQVATLLAGMILCLQKEVSP